MSSEVKKKGPKEEKHEGGGKGKESGKPAPQRALEATWGFASGSVKKVKDGIWNRVKAVVGGTWGATGGAVGEGVKQVGRVFGYEHKEGGGGPLHAIASISKSIRTKIFGEGFIGKIIGIPFAPAERFLEESENIVYGAVTGKRITKSNGGKASESGEAHAAR